ncbi:hypothetical protein [Kaistia sp. MMO-174]|uniref:hypothetical protein n=1 Tax=Kaistia sp. MMO-174 TaxID=3081256 RepID=UPI0030159C25
MSRNYLVCAGCHRPLDIGDRYYPGICCTLGVCCAPTFDALLQEPTSFVERDDDTMPLSREKRQAMLDEHLATGGCMTDSMAFEVVE